MGWLWGCACLGFRGVLWTKRGFGWPVQCGLPLIFFSLGACFWLSDALLWPPGPSGIFQIRSGGCSRSPGWSAQSAAGFWHPPAGRRCGFLGGVKNAAFGGSLARGSAQEMFWAFMAHRSARDSLPGCLAARTSRIVASDGRYVAQMGPGNRRGNAKKGCFLHPPRGVYFGTPPGCSRWCFVGLLRKSGYWQWFDGMRGASGYPEHLRSCKTVEIEATFDRPGESHGRQEEGLRKGTRSARGASHRYLYAVILGGVVPGQLCIGRSF
jgi:hypothetical protein